MMPLVPETPPTASVEGDDTGSVHRWHYENRDKSTASLERKQLEHTPEFA